MPVGFVKQRPSKYESIKNNAKAVKDAESGYQANKGALEVQICFENHQ